MATALYEPIDVQFHCVIEKASVEEEKNIKIVSASPTQYEWNIERELTVTLANTDKPPGKPVGVVLKKQHRRENLGLEMYDFSKEDEKDVFFRKEGKSCNKRIALGWPNEYCQYN